MTKPNQKTLHHMVLLIIFLTVIITSIGVFYKTGGSPYEIKNQYGQIVKIYGDGIYAHDSYFKAPISRGTDFVILFLTVPLLLASLILDIKKNSIKTRLFLTSLISLITYYSSSIAFGVTYNFLHLAYIALFSSSIFTLIISIMSIDFKTLEISMDSRFSYKGIYVFLVLTGISLIIAWLPDIIKSLINNESLALIEVYTTEVTYVLDMGIIGPLALMTIPLLKNKQAIGYIILEILLTVCSIVGIMLPMQTYFQIMRGIEIPLIELITKVGIFCTLSLSALYFNIKFLKSIKE